MNGIEETVRVKKTAIVYFNGSQPGVREKPQGIQQFKNNIMILWPSLITLCKLTLGLQWIKALSKCLHQVANKTRLFLIGGKGIFLAKYSPGANFTNILRAAFVQIFLHQKSINLQCKYRKAAIKSFEKKAAH